MVIESLKQKHLRPYFASMSWLLVDNIIRKIIGLFLAIWIARYLGPEQFGKLNFAIAFVLIFSIFADLGLRDIVVRDLVREPHKSDEILATTFILKLFGGVLVLIISLCSIIILRPTDTLTWWLVGAISAGYLFMAFDVADYWFQSQVQLKYSVMAKGIIFILFSILRVFLILSQSPLLTFALILSLEIFFQSLSLFIIYRVRGRSIQALQATFNRARILLANSWPLMLIGFAFCIQSYIDQIMLGQILGDEEVGQYTAAFRLIEVFVLIPSIICMSISPAITRAKMRDNNLYYQYLLNSYRLMFLLFLLTFVPVFIFAKPLVGLLYGDAYQYSGELLALLALRLFFINFGISRNILFIVNEGLFFYSLVTAVIGAGTDILLNYFLIPRYHSVGAIWAGIISFSISMFLIDSFYPKAAVNLKLMFKGITTFWKLKISQ